ncbi:helix-turn-helix domain-containing protein [Streptomyces youssoufiensis]
MTTRRLTYPEAAAELPGVTETWLRKHIKKLPHTKVGRAVYFTPADLERIDALFHHEPTAGPLAAVPAQPRPAGAHPMGHLRPLPARKRTA